MNIQKEKKGRKEKKARKITNKRTTKKRKRKPKGKNKRKNKEKPFTHFFKSGNFSEVKQLEIKSWATFNDASFSIMIKLCPNLTKLDLTSKKNKRKSDVRKQKKNQRKKGNINKENQDRNEKRN